MVRPERFELPTCCSGGNRSIQLSYGRARVSTVYMGKGSGINVNIPQKQMKHAKVTLGCERVWRRGRIAQDSPRLLGSQPHGRDGDEIFLGLSFFSNGRAARHHRRLGHRDLRGRVRHRLHRRPYVQSWDALR